MSTLTVKALLTTAALEQFELGAFHFCANAACDVVYFGDGQHFGIADVRVPVWQKEAAGNRMICYCFGENETGIRMEIDDTGASAAVGRVRAHIAAKRCACEVRNPRGVCCLADVVAAVERVQSSLQTAERR